MNWRCCMATPSSNPANRPEHIGPPWGSWLGIIAVVLGVFLTASHGTELMKQAVITQSAPAGEQFPASDCPEDEIEEEGLSVAECEQMVTNVRGIILSTPHWFPNFQMGLAFVGTVLAFLSILVGSALLNYRRWAPVAAIPTFGALAAIDVLGFLAVVNTGPILRSLYLWNILLWLIIHMMMTVAAVAGRQSVAAS